MSDQLRIALVRALIGGFIQAGVVFFGALAAGAGQTGKVNSTVLVIAGIGAGAAFFSTLAVRFAGEGLIDTNAAAKGPGAWQVAPVRLQGMSWLIKAVIAVCYAAIAYIICVALTIFLPDMGFPIATQLAELIAKFTLLICVIVFLLVLFAGAPWVPTRWRSSAAPPSGPVVRR